MKRFTLFLLLILSSLAFSARAESSLKITEIMYDLPGSDTDREWIEVYNAGDSDIDLSLFKFFEGNTNHGLVPISSPTLPAGSFAIIADKPENFSTDWPDFSGLVFDSSFSLSNTGEDLALKDADGNILDQISYSSDMGALGDGLSLSREGETFVPTTPTPGESNDTSEPPPPPPEEELADDEPVDEEPAEEEEESGSGGGSSSEATPASKKSVPKTLPFSMKIDLPTHAISNSDFLVSVVITGVDTNQSPKYVWNFGNGDVIETRYKKPFGYIYQYPGTYVITLSYFKDDFAEPIKASGKIKVEENPIIISAILPDGSVEIKNNATHQTDLSGWVLKSGVMSFTMPSGTVLMAKSSVIFPSKVTKFISGISSVNLFFPSGTLAYSSSAGVKYLPKSDPAPVIDNSALRNETPVPSLIESANLSASVINSAEEDNPNSTLPWMLGLGGIILVASIASFFIFSGSSGSSSGFKINE